MDDHIARTLELRNAYKKLLRENERNSHSKDIGVDGSTIIRMDLREIGWKTVDWMHVVQYRDQCWTLVNTVMKLRVP
jgi:hypothetical protein